MLAQVLAILVPIIFSIVLRNSLEHDNMLLDKFGNTTSRVLLVTAHPDDETMFFAPTLLGLLKHPKEAVEIYSLCLSTGDADGLGLTRPRELARALDILGVDEGKHWIVDHPDLKDDITATWDPQVIADVVAPYISQNSITTFQGPMAPVLAKYDIALQHIWHTAYVYFLGSPKEEVPHMPVFVSSISDYRVALHAMYEHWSQLVWFRWLYVGASRYMWVNEWAQVVAPKQIAGGSNRQ
ncbi:hypothetical protein HWV62_24868 [Athelia sp. TMB]|nr:hypothetical protein HWV62_24868 [Athelia sp. TMB]